MKTYLEAMTYVFSLCPCSLKAAKRSPNEAVLSVLSGGNGGALSSKAVAPRGPSPMWSTVPELLCGWQDPEGLAVLLASFPFVLHRERERETRKLGYR